MGDALAQNAAWSYEHPVEPISGIKDLIAFYRDKVDAWYEGDLISP